MSTVSVKLDGKTVKTFRGSGNKPENDAFEWLLKNQNFSVGYAVTYGGYSVWKNGKNLNWKW